MDNITKKIQITIVIYILSCLTVKTMTITGMVMDTTNSPLPFSTITISELNLITTSNQHGRFTIKNISPGKYIIQASCIGYKTQQTTVDVEEKDISVNFKLHELNVLLQEVVVNSSKMETMILDKLVATPKLKKKIKNWHANANCIIESVGNLRDYPSRLRNIIRISLSLMGYKKIFICMEKYPNFMIGINQDVDFNKGKIKSCNRFISECSNGITDEEKHSFLEKKWKTEENIYDEIYRTVRKLYKEQKKANKKDKLQYMGTYNYNDYKIHLLKSTSYELHIVTNHWQIYKMVYYNGKKKYSIECGEYSQGLFLPIYFHSEDIFDLDEKHKWKVVNTISLKYTLGALN